MKEVVEVFGKFFLEGLVIGGLFINIIYGIKDNEGNQGIFQIIGDNLSIEKIEHTKYEDFRGTYIRECNKDMPNISFLGTHLKMSNNKLSDYFVAYDYAGRELPIVVKHIFDLEGVEHTELYNRDLNEINFSKAGIYVLEVEVKDNENRIRRWKVQVPVCL